MDWTVKAKNPLWKQYLGDLEVFTAKDSRIKNVIMCKHFRRDCVKRKTLSKVLLKMLTSDTDYNC